MPTIRSGCRKLSWDEAHELARSTLDAFCLRHGIRTDWLARESGVSFSTISKLRAGWHEATPSTLAKIVPVLSRYAPVSADDLRKNL